MEENKILTMSAGREIDALVAEKIMDWTDIQKGNYRDIEVWSGLETPNAALRSFVSHYSTNISAAWEVVEKMDKFQFTLDNCWSTDPSKKWLAYFGHGVVGGNDFSEGEAEAETVPLAICRAALLTVEEK